MAAVVVCLAVLAGMPPVAGDPLASPPDFRATGGSFDLGIPCQVRASVFVDNDRVPDGDRSSRITAYYQMETRPDDGLGSYYWDDWADWDQPAARRQGSWNEFDLYRQDVNPLAFERGYVGQARRWEGALPVPTEVPPTNLGYSVWSYGFKSFGPGGQRQDWRVVRERSPNGGPPGSTDNLVSIVRKQDVPFQPLPMAVRGGTEPGPPDSGIVRVLGADGIARAWTARSAVTFAVTGLDATCTSSNKADAAQRDAATHPTCEPDPVSLTACWNHAVASNSSPSGGLDYTSDGAYSPSPYCAHLAGHVVTYGRADRSDCPAKSTLGQYRDQGVLPSWWCSSKTAFGFCTESQVDWIGNRQQRVWMQAFNQATGAETHALMGSWYGDPQGNVSRNNCPRQADGSAIFGNPRVCFYEGWWQGELSMPITSDGRHPVVVQTIDDTFRSWLKGAPGNVQNRSGGTSVVHRDTVGPRVTGAMDAVAEGSSITFSAGGVMDPGDLDAAVGVNPADVWLYACRRGSSACDAGAIPEGGDSADLISMTMSSTDGTAFDVTAAGAPEGEWFWKVVPYDLLGNRGEVRTGALLRVIRAEASPDSAVVDSGGVSDVDVTANDLWSPASASISVALVSYPSRGDVVLVPRPSGPPVARYTSAAGTAEGEADVFRYRLCATEGASTGCSEAAVTVQVRAASQRRPT